MNSRPHSEPLDKILSKSIPVLDNGFIAVRDYMGNDQSIEAAARISYGEGTRKVSETRGLLRYLMRHKHTSPFEMCEIQLHVKLPIFVARQWVRHRTANVNEYSARYSILDKEFYVPEIDQIQLQSKNNKQGRDKKVEHLKAQQIQRLLISDANVVYDTYENLINSGLARELSRMSLSVNYYTQWIWKIDLHNLFHFLKLRCDPHAQWEIRVYAEEILKICKAWVPLATEAFEDYMLKGYNLSRMELEMLQDLLTFTDSEAALMVQKKHPNMSLREIEDFQKAFLRGPNA